MHRKASIAIAIAVIAVGIGVYALQTNTDKTAPAAAGPSAAPQRPSQSPAAGANPAPAAGDAKAKPREAGAWSRLTEKYGGTRTNLSQKVTTDIADVLDQTLELADMGAQMGGSKTVAEAAAKETVRGLADQLGLTDEQKTKAAGIVESAVNQRLGTLKELTGAMRGDPEAMMEMLLAGDAVSRNEMTQAEYDETTAATRQMLQNISGFLVGRNPGAAGAPLFGDEQFTQQLGAILTPEQQALLTEYSQKMADQAAQTQRPGRLPFQNGTIPVMELEKLEQTVASAKLMTGGLRQLMEGMKGMQQNLPTPPTE